MFISYSHKDRRWLEALQDHLRPLERERRITRWDDTLIQSGSLWREEIKRALEEARVAVLLVSKNFLASDFIATNELPPLLLAAETAGATILPVLIGPCRFSRTEGLSNYQAVNPPDRTLMEMAEAEQDRVWLTLAYRIEDLLDAPLALINSSDDTRKVLSGTELSRPASAVSSLLSASVAHFGADSSEPDLYILVRRSGNGNILSFQLKEKNASLGLDDRLYGPVELATDPWRYFGEQFRDIEDLAATNDEEREIARIRLEAKGSYLFENILPDDLQKILWNLQGKVHSVLIQSDEGIIPWELFKFSRRGERGPFFCEAFALSRWITGFEPHMKFPLANIAWISTRGVDGSPPSGDDCQQLVAAGHSVTMVPATFLRVHDALASGKFDGLHFATHSYARGLPSKWRIYLEDNKGLAPEDLVGMVRNLGATRPLVFLNTCHSGLNAETIVGVSGWAVQFINAGCGAFIGSYWNLEDRVADSFQAAFYRYFTRGFALGEAVRRARLEVRSEGDPTWLSYTVYGHPNARLKGQGAESKTAEGAPA